MNGRCDRAGASPIRCADAIHAQVWHGSGPPRAAVPPARGGIGSSERPARADPGELPFRSPGQQAPVALQGQGPTQERRADLQASRSPVWHGRDGKAVVIVFGRVGADTRCRVAVFLSAPHIMTHRLGRVRRRRSQRPPLSLRSGVRRRWQRRQARCPALAKPRKPQVFRCRLVSSDTCH
jgi:hypothetical protein